MDLFNRLIVTLLAFLLAIGGTLVVGVTAGLLQPTHLGQAPDLARLALLLRSLPGMGPFWAGLGGGGAALAGILLLWLELRPRRRERLLVIQRDKSGEVTVSLVGLTRLAEHVVSSFPDVQAVRADTRAARNGVAFCCRITLKPEANTPALAQEIRERLSSAVMAHVGMPASVIHVHTRVGSLTEGRRRVR
jgi:hypothetical protein